MRLIDLSQDIYHMMPHLPNHPSIVITTYATHDQNREADGYQFTNATMALAMGDHAGTHVDAPRHFDAQTSRGMQHSTTCLAPAAGHQSAPCANDWGRALRPTPSGRSGPGSCRRRAAARYRLSTSSISLIAIRHGVHAQAADPKKVQAASKLIQRGMPLRHVAQTVGLGYQRLRHLLAKQGVYKVPPGRHDGCHGPQQ